MFKQADHERGQAIIVLALVMVGLLAFAALAIDGGNTFAEKRQTQNAGDAAALAGTRQIVLECARQGLNPGPNEANIRNKVAQMVAANSPGATVQVYYVDANGARLSQNEVGTLGVVPCSCAGRASGLEVTVKSSSQTFLAGLIGRNKIEVQATGKARFAPVGRVESGLYPLTRRDMPFTFNQVATLRILDDPDELPGNFGWLSWEGSNDIPTLVAALTPPGTSYTYYNPGEPSTWIANHNDHAITVGKWLQGMPGNKNSQGVRDQLDWWISTQTPMAIPLYDAVAGQGTNGYYRAASFAAFVLQGYDLTGQDKSITGKFVKWVTNGDWAQGVPCSQEGGLYSVKLTP
jgi:Flp pilus assembly protein TadG